LLQKAETTLFADGSPEHASAIATANQGVS
jgi:hypothetical protein